MSEHPDLSPHVDVNHLLQQADPEFSEGLEAVRLIENAADVVIEASALDLDGGGDDDTPESAAAAGPEVSGPFSLKALPREVLRYGWSQVRGAGQAFRAADRRGKLLMLTMVALGVLAFYLVAANLRGTWVPGLTAPVLTRLAPYADKVEAYDPAKDGVSLNAAFPPEIHEFLFKPFKVNLRATDENPHPMGAFEFIVTVDTKETAIETRDREVEFSDLLQRVFEEETVHDLATELGKAQLKSRIQAAVNPRLSAGRVTEVHFKTFVLKP